MNSVVLNNVITQIIRVILSKGAICNNYPVNPSNVGWSQTGVATLELEKTLLPCTRQELMFDSERFYQACVIPYRATAVGFEFCLITSKKTGKWSLPKGTIRSEETVSDTIARQSHKEAGIRGELIETPVGTYSYHKWETILEVVVLMMLVEECDAEWPDSDTRKRCWVPGDEAITKLDKSDHKKLMRKAIENL